MARMFPKQLIADTHSAAERKLFAKFQQELGDDFLVFHSVAWVGRSRDGRACDGEADFVIAHPDLGILVIEVKGGRIEYEGSTGRWFTTDRNDDRHLLSKDPLTQAKDAHYNLHRKLQDAPLTCSHNYPVFHALCFPDVTIDKDLRLDLPLSLVLDQKRLIDAEQAIRDIFQFWSKGRKGTGPGNTGIAALVELLAPTVELHSFMGAEFEDEAETIKQLTQQQQIALDLLSRERRAIIFGCAGSGKTMLALEKARRLVSEGCSVLFVCFNVRLADWLSASPYNQHGFKIITFHKLCIELARKADISIPPLASDVVQGNEDYYFSVILPQALLDAAKQLGPQHSALIVDEGQDFRGSWWVALEALLTYPTDDVFYIFCDDNQNIYADVEQEYPFSSPSVTLNRNCRNTRRIHEVVAKYYRGPLQLQTQGPDGRDPEILVVSQQHPLRDVLQQRLHELVNQHRVRPHDIAILTPRSAKSSILRSGTKLGNFVLTWNTPNSDSEIECSSIHAFKGLERAIIILTELEYLTGPDKEKLAYIGVSRARNHLIVLGSLP